MCPICRIKYPEGMLENANGAGLKGVTTPDQVVGHFNLVHHQLLYIRAGLALAKLTGRALIMPPVWCEVDRHWQTMLEGKGMLVCHTSYDI